MIKVFLILNQIKFRNSLEQALKLGSNFVVSSMGIDYPKIKESFAPNPPEAVIIESNPLDDGIKLVKFLRNNYPMMKVIVFTNSDFEENILELSKLGVKSFLYRIQAELLSRVIEIITIGGIYFPDGFAEIFQRRLLILNNSKTIDRDMFLSPIDLSLIRLICEGLSSTEIGAIMKKSPRTIEDHRGRLYKKFNVGNKEKFIAEAVKKNIV